MRRARLDSGLTQAELAAAIGWRRVVVHAVEAGKRRVDPVELAEWAAGVDVPLARFLRDLEGAAVETVAARRRGLAMLEAKAEGTKAPVTRADGDRALKAKLRRRPARRP